MQPWQQTSTGCAPTHCTKLLPSASQMMPSSLRTSNSLSRFSPDELVRVSCSIACAEHGRRCLLL